MSEYVKCDLNIAEAKRQVHFISVVAGGVRNVNAVRTQGSQATLQRLCEGLYLFGRLCALNHHGRVAVHF